MDDLEDYFQRLLNWEGQPARTLTWDIEEVATALKVDVQSVREYFTDGRRVALQRGIVEGWWRTNRLGTCTEISRERALELVRLLP